MQTQVNFGRWLERLGTKIADQPEYLNVVQPVALVRDEREVVSAVPGVRGFVGVLGNAGVGTFSGLRLNPGGSGGYTSVLVKAVTANTGLVFCRIAATPAAGVSTNIPIGSEDPARPVLATCDEVPFAALGGAGIAPTFNLNTATAIVWVPPGLVCEFMFQFANVDLTWSLQIVEYPPENAP